LGLDYIVFSSSNVYKYTSGGTTTEDEYKLTTHLIIPNLGFKLGKKTGDIFPFFGASVMYVIPMVNIEETGATNTSEQEDDAKDVLNIFGIGLSFGTEYFFSDNFSFGGELGFTFFMQKNENEYVGPFGDTDLDTFKNRLGMTRSSFNLNYYF
jgi:hypothetical protein